MGLFVVFLFVTFLKKRNLPLVLSPCGSGKWFRRCAYTNVTVTAQLNSQGIKDNNIGNVCLFQWAAPTFSEFLFNESQFYEVWVTPLSLLLKHILQNRIYYFGELLGKIFHLIFHSVISRCLLKEEIFIFLTSVHIVTCLSSVQTNEFNFLYVLDDFPNVQSWNWHIWHKWIENTKLKGFRIQLWIILNSSSFYIKGKNSIKIWFAITCQL